MKALSHSRSEIRLVPVTGELTVDSEFFNHLRVHALAPISLGQTKVCLGECRVLIRQLLADLNGLVVLSYGNVNYSHHRADDRRQRIELVSAISFSNRLLLSAANLANIRCVPMMCRGIVGVEFEGLLVLGLSPGKIPVVLHVIAAQDGMGMGQGRTQLKRLSGGGI